MVHKQAKQHYKYARDVRITDGSIYTKLLSRARRFDVGHLCLCFYPNSVAKARLGMVIAKRNLASAVLRNRLRRIIRDSFRNNQSRIPAFDIVIIAKRTIKLVDFKDGSKEIALMLDSGWSRLVRVLERGDSHLKLKGGDVRNGEVNASKDGSSIAGVNASSKNSFISDIRSSVLP